MPDKILNVDLDGTICDFEYPAMGELKEGVIEALQQLKDDGFYIRIFSCRTSEEVQKYPIDRKEQQRKMEQFLDEKKVPYDEVLNINKPVGIFIDDNAIGFRDNWEDVVKEVDKLKKRK